MRDNRWNLRLSNAQTRCWMEVPKTKNSIASLLEQDTIRTFYVSMKNIYLIYIRACFSAQLARGKNVSYIEKCAKCVKRENKTKTGPDLHADSIWATVSLRMSLQMRVPCLIIIKALLFSQFLHVEDLMVWYRTTLRVLVIFRNRFNKTR